jgi:hypothetical protein
MNNVDFAILLCCIVAFAAGWVTADIIWNFVKNKK